MTTLDQWRALAERVKAATGPDQSLEWAVAYAMGWESHGEVRGTGACSHWTTPDGTIVNEPFKWTVSLDAVVALVEREPWKDEKLLWNVAYDEDGVAGPRSYCGSVLVGYHSPIVWYGHNEHSPALALLAAFARAKVAKLEQAAPTGQHVDMKV